MKTATQQRREARADAIAVSTIKREGDVFIVPSSSGLREYVVTATTCSCPDFLRRRAHCKHMLAVERLCPPAKSVIAAAPVLTLEEELAVLDERLAQLVEREKTIGFTRRFSGLNAQMIRHKRARIQERQIEIRRLLKEKEDKAFAGF